MVRIFICDSDKKWQENAAEILQEYADVINTEIEVNCFEDPGTLISHDGIAPDVLFCSTEFKNDSFDAGSTDGIAVVRKINQLFPNCQVVYVSESLERALDVYLTDHMWYTLKKELKDRLPDIVDKYEELDKRRKANLVIRTTEGLTAIIPCRDILYIERKERKTIIVTYNRKYEVRERISVILDKLPSGKVVRCHNSFAVNMEKIREIQSDGVRMKNGDEIRISRGYSKTFKDEYHRWAAHRIVK